MWLWLTAPQMQKSSAKKLAEDNLKIVNRSGSLTAFGIKSSLHPHWPFKAASEMVQMCLRISCLMLLEQSQNHSECNKGENVLTLFLPLSFWLVFLLTK